MAMRDPDIDDLNEEELTEYLAKHENEDLIADETDSQEDFESEPVKKEEKEEIPLDESKSLIREEIEIKSPKEKKIIKKAEAKQLALLEKEKKKRAKAKKKAFKKGSVTLTRYDLNPEVGLTAGIVEDRVLDGLVNKTTQVKSKSIGRIIFTNTITFFNILIFFIAGCLIAVGAITDLTFLVIVLINIIVGIVQEIRAKKTIDALQLINAQYAIVKRDGLNKEIPIEEVVLDDLLLLDSGKQICADSIVIEGQVEVNESMITGESDAIIKKPGDLLYSGSFVVSGKCSARVDKVGKENYIEQLSSQAKVYKKPKSDLLQSLNLIIKAMSIPIILIGVTLFLIMYYRSSIDIVTSVRKTAGAMIGMIPSGLFLMSTIALYVGVVRLGQKNVLVQELYCIEMLARVNCICLDKTGTITDGTMVVKNVIDYNTVHGLATKNIVSAILNASPDRNMTSDALIAKFGLNKRIKHLAMIPFSSQRKYQAITFDKYGTFVMGAPEFVLQNAYTKVAKDVEKYAKLGFRVLCLAHKDGNIVDNNLPEGDIEVLSMILIEDNIRPDAISTIKYFNESGVEVRVISGDNPITVSKISERAGVPNASNYVSLDGMTDAEVVRAALKYTVFGRVTPSQKRLIIKTLKANDKVVAMTGDGVNDILALREADCSIALASGSDATRNCSHLVLLDSNFGSMPSVVAEGRRVINNVTSVASLFLTKTIFSLFLALLALITGSYPISTIQLIMIDILAIGVPSLVLVNEPNNNPVQGRFLVNVVRKALPGALVILIMSLLILFFSDRLHLDTMSSNTLLIIAATHTCLMVLYKACHPFTQVRKALFGFCYTIFVVAIFVLPQLLELRPITPFFEYYSNTASTTYMTKNPSVSVSAANHYVIDGIYTDDMTFSDTVSFGCYKNAEDEKYYYTINNSIQTNKEVYMPEVKYAPNGHLYVGGYKLNNITYTDDIESHISYNSNGYMFYDGKEVTITLNKTDKKFGYEVKYGQTTSKDIHYSILPTVTQSNGEFLINGISPSDGSYKVPVEFASITGFDVSMNPLTRELLINGKTITKTFTKGGTDSKPYIIDAPIFTTTSDRVVKGVRQRNEVYIDCVDTGLNIFTLYGMPKQVSGSDQKTYTLEKDEQYKTICYRYEVDGTISSYEKGKEETTLLDDINFNVDGFTENLYNDFIYIDSLDVLHNIDILNNLKAVMTVDSEHASYDLQQVSNGTSYPSLVYDTEKIVTNVSISNSMFAPSVEISKDNMYIIEGYYTSYGCTPGDINMFTQTIDIEQDEVDSSINHNYLVLGNTKTDYEIADNNIKTVTGMTVYSLSTVCIVLLLMLCAFANPLIKLFQYILPWVNKQFKGLSKFLNRFQP